MKYDDEELGKLLLVAWISGVAGALLGVLKVIIHENRGTIMRFFRGACAAVVVAVLSAFALNDTGMSWSRQAAIIGILAYVADDVLSGLVILGKLFGNNPLAFLKDLWSSFRGGSKNDGIPGRSVDHPGDVGRADLERSGPQRPPDQGVSSHDGRPAPPDDGPVTDQR
jgi:hypothetical protein